MIGYLTPDSGGGVYLCRRFRFRAELAPMITSQLEELILSGSWELWGDLTVEEMTDFATEMLNSYLDSGDRCMIGTITHYLTSTPPDGVLPLDGNTYNADDYPDLFAVLDPQYDNGNGTFTLPDIRGRVLLGAGAGSGLSSYDLGDTVGAESHTLDISEIPSHDHLYGLATSDLLVVAPGEAPASSGITAPTATSATGGGGAHENRQPSYAAHAGVWYK